ncbi:HD-GYP domain-containing protein [Desulfitobacterium hafniense]|uniref:HD-GYP domain-containing protein n=3 Tax=Desulfitobacterium hafniense TaxID=49338 RepID=Q250J5_DESHY|nr:HD-GYP domain-containing protein [Desulfitobacterium hafniense]ACL18526.1 metal dependent phosphohydrolase [Desulfitobacterium hafniense DCB-2]KTE92934.1 hypothetical protein AT727_17250 [Desulfitobacterium hafniense]BAE82297.1 hypothetical protein DSY0508 [Desulfitobacterium hafniense Y51]
MLKANFKFRSYFNFIVFCATLILIWSMLSTHWEIGMLSSFLIFAVLTVASECLPVALPKGGYVTVSCAVFVAAAILFPMGVILPIATCGALILFGKAAEDQPLWKRFFNASQFIISLAMAKTVLIQAGLTDFAVDIRHLPFYLLAAFTYMLSNVTLVSIALGKISGKSPWAIWKGNIRWSVPNFLALAPLGVLMAMIYVRYGPLGLIMLSVPLLLARHSFQLYIDMRKNYLNTVTALVQALEAKDSYTSGHSSRVAQWSIKLAEEMNLPEDRVEFIKYAGILHDVGKIGVSETILNKKGKLDDAEWKFICNHPVIGQNIIQSIDFLFDVGSAVRFHHERFDGAGYPDGIKGKDIPQESRIIAVADTYDAMTSSRSYRQALSSSEAIAELRRVAGSQLDPEVVEAFCRVIQKENQMEKLSPITDMPIAN